MIKVGIIGATGYTGVELIRLIQQHPVAELKIITSRELKGKKVSTVFPSLINICDLVFKAPDDKDLKSCDIVFFATPHGVAMKNAEVLFDKDIKIIDLSADFRIKDSVEWSKWYNIKHTNNKLLSKAVYGLPEIYRDEIKKAKIIANPGCFPTAIILGLKPLLEANCINLDNIVADCKSGVSGAGRKANIPILFCESNENFKAYNVSKHRHYPEIKQILEQIANSDIEITFIPHLIPMLRGIYATIYVDLVADIDINKIYENSYKDEMFVSVLEEGVYPETRSVKASNYCHISVQKLKNSNKVIIMSVIDNLVKGASGQAVQNMNLMFGIDEQTGLEQISTML